MLNDHLNNTSERHPSTREIEREASNQLIAYSSLTLFKTSTSLIRINRQGRVISVQLERVFIINVADWFKSWAQAAQIQVIHRPLLSSKWFPLRSCSSVAWLVRGCSACPSALANRRDLCHSPFVPLYTRLPFKEVSKESFSFSIR